MAAALQGSILCTAQGSCCQPRAAARTEFQGSQRIASASFRHNEVRLASQVLSELEFRAPPQRRRKNVVVQAASFKDMVKAVLRFAANSPLRYLIKELDHELEEVEEKIKAGVSIAEGMAHTVDKIAHAVEYGAHGVEENVEKIQKNMEKVHDELHELLEEVEEGKKGVQKIADAAEYGAHGVEELVEKIEKTVEKLDDGLDEVLEEVQEEKKAVKVLEEKVEQAEIEIIEKQIGKMP